MAAAQAVRSAWPKVSSASRSARRAEARSKEGGGAVGGAGAGGAGAVTFLDAVESAREVVKVLRETEKVAEQLRKTQPPPEALIEGLHAPPAAVDLREPLDLDHGRGEGGAGLKPCGGIPQGS